MFKNKINVFDNWLIFKYKQFNLFFSAKMFDDLKWKVYVVGSW
jgi:hypothetical protein